VRQLESGGARFTRFLGGACSFSDPRTKRFRLVDKFPSNADGLYSTEIPKASTLQVVRTIETRLIQECTLEQCTFKIAIRKDRVGKIASLEGD
jgi:hypothetical protein